LSRGFPVDWLRRKRESHKWHATGFNGSKGERLNTQNKKASAIVTADVKMTP
jgi:hypothetical protein